MAATASSRAGKPRLRRSWSTARSIGKALLPTLAVMGFAAALALPAGWVVLGAVLIGAATSGVVNYAYEQRMNQFRPKGEKKSRDKILRDVSIAAAVDGAVAPFTMLTAGFVSHVGPATLRTILTTAGKVGLAQYAGSTLANVTRAGVTNAWYYGYYGYGDKEKALKDRQTALENKTNRTRAEEDELLQVMKDLEKLRKEKYTMQQFVQDEKTAMANAVISGFVGGAVGGVAAQSDWAKIASTKMLGTPDKAGLVANAVVSNPFAFISGANGALLKRDEIKTEIARCKKIQRDLPADSAAYRFYADKIAGLEASYAALDPVEAGTSALVANAAVQSAVMTAAVGKAQLFDLPAQRRQAINARYQADDPAWQKANQAKVDLDEALADPPAARQFGSLTEFDAAKRQYDARITELKTRYNQARLDAVAAESAPANKARLDEIAGVVDHEIDLNRRAALAQSLGTPEYTEFKMREIADRPGAPTDPAKIRELAVQEIRQEHLQAAVNKAKALEDMERKLAFKEDPNAHAGVRETGENGKQYYVLRDAQGQEVFRRELQPPSGFLAKLFKLDPNSPTWGEMRKSVRMAETSADMVKPSAYRATYIDMKVSELRGQGMTRVEIANQMPAITAEANTRMIGAFGSSWENVVKSEMLAAGLERARFSDGAPPDVKKLVETINATVQAGTVSQFQAELNAQTLRMVETIGREGDLPATHQPGYRPRR